MPEVDGAAQYNAAEAPIVFVIRSLPFASQRTIPGLTIALSWDRRTIIMNHFWTKALLGAVLVIPITLVPTTVRAEDHGATLSYHDKKHNDDHEWNSHEDQAYRLYVQQNHRTYGDFAKLKDNDQQKYWAWRHQHSDAQLKIVIR
jgi:hypothetical protein